MKKQYDLGSAPDGMTAWAKAHALFWIRSVPYIGVGTKMLTGEPLKEQRPWLIEVTQESFGTVTVRIPRECEVAFDVLSGWEQTEAIPEECWYVSLIRDETVEPAEESRYPTKERR